MEPIFSSSLSIALVISIIGLTTQLIIDHRTDKKKGDRK
jgi:hypothetical protein